MKSQMKHRQIIYIVIILLLQLLMILKMDSFKQEYHIDEIYSYLLSNSYDADKISNAAPMWSQWISGTDFDEFITVQEGEAFAYKTVYLNNSTDCHPPLYYWMLHTVSSFFPNRFSKWFGLSLNIVFFIACQLVLYELSGLVIKNESVRLLPLIMYGGSVYMMETVSFIRMYMLLTLFTLLSVYIYVKLIQDNFSPGLIIASWVLIYLGAMTQYYSLILNFWCIAILSVIMLKRKEIKKIVIYDFGAVLSVLLMFVSYPYVFQQATGTSTNNVGNQVSENLFNIRLWGQMTVSLFRQIIEKLSYSRIISYAIVIVAVTVFVVLAIKNKKDNFRISTPVCFLFFVVILTMLTISFIGGEYVFLRYIYFIIPLLYLIVFAYLDFMLDKANARMVVFQVLAGVCICFSIANTMLGSYRKQSAYLYIDKAQENRVLSEYKHDKLVVITGEIEPAVPTGNLTKLRLFDSLYMDTWEQISGNSVVAACMEQYHRCVVFINTDTYWTKGLNHQEVLDTLLKTTSATTYNEICGGGLGKYYILSE